MIEVIIMCPYFNWVDPDPAAYNMVIVNSRLKRKKGTCLKETESIITPPQKTS